MRQYTDDPNILRLINTGNQAFAAQLAFTQEELDKLVDEQPTIYLVGSESVFTIPLDRKNKKYIGITRDKGGVPVRFPTSKPVEVNALGLKFQNVLFVGNYQPSSASERFKRIYS